MKKMYGRLIVMVIAFTAGFFVTSGIGWDNPTDISACVARGTHKQQCWQDAVIDRLKRRGVGESLTLLALLYEGDPEFANPCHDVAHKIGQAAYMLFAEGKPVTVNEKTAYCSFGFYHGFMETLLSKKAGIEKAQEFCASVDTQLGKDISRAVLACYHGVGHGVVDTHSPVTAGDERATIAPGMELCRQFARTDEQLRLCGTGIFDALAIAYYNRANGFVMRPSDPLWICRELPEPFKEACFMDLMDAVLWLGEYDLAQAAPYVERFVEARHAPAAMKGLADASIRFILHTKDPALSVPVCRAQRPDLRRQCIEGLASGMMQFGEPDKEYVAAFDLCRRDVFTPEERGWCFESVISSARFRYPRERFEHICSSLEDVYRDRCND